MRTIFDKLNVAYARYYSPTEHLAVSEIVVLFKGRVREFIPKKCKWFGMKICHLCDSKMCAYNMTVF
jgi:hypothetical protein